MATTLEKIIKKYSNLEYNHNYDLGGGLVSNKFASNRHEDALSDKGKLTLGKCNLMFSKATGLSVAEVKEVILHVFPRLEWHHAGKRPQVYGGKMNRTYFINAEQIVDLASEFTRYVEEVNLLKEDAEIKRKKLLVKNTMIHDFLKENATYISRIKEIPKLFHVISSEMKGKYGWFEVDYSYKLDIYYSGWEFKDTEKYNEFIKIL